MPVTRINHAVLYVRNVQRTVDFYRDLLDFRVKFEIPGQAAFLQAPASQNDHDLGVFQIGDQAGPSQAGRSTVGLYHLAWEVDTLDELTRLAEKLSDAGALVGTKPLDLAAERARYGGSTRGGVGVSFPALV
jgi:catechol 2,3-dioxygenase-like lactoylglutathione lyase family enzyme